MVCFNNSPDKKSNNDYNTVQAPANRNNLPSNDQDHNDDDWNVWVPQEDLAPIFDGIPLNSHSFDINRRNLDNMDVDMRPIKKYTNITHINFGLNSFNWMPLDLTWVPQLQLIDLTGNNLVGLPDSFAKLQHLRHIILNDNMLDVVANGSVNCTPNLEILELNCNKLKQLPKFFKPVHTLRYLDLDRNQLFGPLPLWLNLCTKLEVLTYEYNPILKVNPLPRDFGRQQKCLRMISGAKCLDNVITQALSLAENLEFFDPGHWNERATLYFESPRNHNSHLHDVDVSKMNPRVLVKKKYKIDYYKPLSSENMKLAKFNWYSLGQTPMLKLAVLLLDNCRLDYIPDTIGDAMPNLELMDFSYNEIKSLPSTFTKMTKLRCVYLNCNKISSLPGDIGELKLLEEIHVACNNIDEIPPSFTELMKLKVIDMRNNPLFFLPPFFHKSTELESFGFPSMENIILWPDLYSLAKVSAAFANGERAQLARSRICPHYKKKKDSINEEILEY